MEGVREDSSFSSSKEETEHSLRQSLGGTKYLHGVALKLARFPLHSYCPRAHNSQFQLRAMQMIPKFLSHSTP